MNKIIAIPHFAYAYNVMYSDNIGTHKMCICAACIYYVGHVQHYGTTIIKVGRRENCNLRAPQLEFRENIVLLHMHVEFTQLSNITS